MTILDCILDQCPEKKSIFVDHIVCSKCVYNPLGDEQPKVGCQECTNKNAIHDPKKENMDIIRSTAGIGHLLWIKR